ncbi:MAG: hypothetical protein Q8R53_02840 [Nanoarchaeota archaeon]|nr:hypothetical protein [Nanoarchaeota archaeon]
MEPSYLIQRLRKPRGSVNPFSFGAGGPYGGFTPEALVICNTVWSFDYMGAAQFEHGAVPKALERIVQYAHRGQAITQAICLDEQVAYSLCKQGTEQEVAQRITQMYTDERALHLLEYCGLQDSLKSKNPDIVGWLELENAYMFFIDENMFQGALHLLGGG